MSQHERERCCWDIGIGTARRCKRHATQRIVSIGVMRPMFSSPGRRTQHANRATGLGVTTAPIEGTL